MSHAPSTAARGSDLIPLTHSIDFMDALSQEGFGEIAALARLALCRLETPEGSDHIDDVAVALRHILDKSADIREAIHEEAERLGCGHDPAVSVSETIRHMM